MILQDAVIAGMVGLVGGLTIVSLTGCGASAEQKETSPVIDSTAEKVQTVPFEGMAPNSPAIIFDVTRPDGTKLTCSTKRESNSGVSCFPQVAR